MFKLVDGILQLPVKYHPVGHDDHRVKDLDVLIIVQTDKPVGKPPDGVTLPTAG